MTVNELRELTSEELDEKILELKKELFNLRFQHAINQLDNPHKIEDVKRDIARTLMVIGDKTRAPREKKLPRAKRVKGV